MCAVKLQLRIYFLCTMYSLVKQQLHLWDTVDIQGGAKTTDQATKKCQISIISASLSISIASGVLMLRNIRLDHLSVTLSDCRSVGRSAKCIVTKRLTGRGGFWRCLPPWPNGFNGVVLTEIYSTRVWEVDNISLRTIYRWNLRFIGFPDIQSSSRPMLGFTRNLQNCNS